MLRHEKQHTIQILLCWFTICAQTKPSIADFDDPYTAALDKWVGHSL